MTKIANNSLIFLYNDDYSEIPNLHISSYSIRSMFYFSNLSN
jgi:hypothetical protein